MTDETTSAYNRQTNWQAPQRPEWLAAANREANSLDLDGTIPLDPESLMQTAERQTGLKDYGEDYWREPFEILCQDLQGDAELNLMGRLVARNDVLMWLKNRLLITDLTRRHPEILEQEIHKPTFIVGLPRSGTSILFEVLSQDSQFGVPLYWEASIPVPPPEQSTYTTDPRIDYVHNIATQWERLCPEFATMHKMGGNLPAECGLIMANSFISDHIISLHQGSAYPAWYASADMMPAYEYHKVMLQILQWKNPRRHWLLKAPAHQNFLDILLQVYPDAQIIQTHRDPIKCMASATNMMGCLYYMRSDKAFDANAFDDFMKGENTARRLEQVMDQREQGIIPEANICDSRYQDLMENPVACVENIYRHFGMNLSDAARQSMVDYLKLKPQGKFGKHHYSISEDELEERRFFERYQKAYQVPIED